MNSELLLQHFERLSEAPDAISRLRRFILDLAMRGKLVEQDSNDEPADELLKRIEAEKARLVKGGVTGKQTPFEAPSQTDVPFPIPQTWAWVAATYPAYVISDLGKKIQTKDVLDSGEFPVVDQGKVFIRGYCNDETKVIRIETPIVLFGDHTRETKLIDFDFVVGADGVKLLQPVCLLTDYYYLALHWLPLDSRGYGRHFKLLRAAFLPLPPLAEQHRIVAKVDELMALCDQLEAAKTEREQSRDRLMAASLHQLQDSNGFTPRHQDAKRDEKAEQENLGALAPWRESIFLQNLPRLTNRPAHIKQLRQTILNLAVRGRLVPQDPNDEPAAELLKGIQLEKGRLIEEGFIRKTKALAPLCPNELPFPLPYSWIWARTENLCEIIVDCPHSTPVFESNGIVCLDTNGFKASGLIQHKIRYVSEKTYQERVLRLVPQAGDIVFAREGNVGASVIIPEGMKCCLGQRVMLFRPMKGVLSTFFSLSLSEPSSLARLLSLHKGIGAKHVNVADMRNAIIPLPPLAEQHRIIAKVDELMVLCDQLEAQLTTTETDSRRLLEAVLHEALAPALGEGV